MTELGKWEKIGIKHNYAEPFSGRNSETANSETAARVSLQNLNSFQVLIESTYQKKSSDLSQHLTRQA